MGVGGDWLSHTTPMATQAPKTASPPAMSGTLLEGASGRAWGREPCTLGLGRRSGWRASLL